MMELGFSKLIYMRYGNAKVCWKLVGRSYTPNEQQALVDAFIANGHKQLSEDQVWAALFTSALSG